ncbi:MAG: AsnC family transcriptional regulator [Methylobacter sp.]|nr:AsnC family transcriptional regulator [Methylobacter sp.]
MIADIKDQQLLEAFQQGLTLSPRPYAELGLRIGLGENEVIERLARLKQSGLIKRLGVIVKHRKLGYCANAMVVWNIPDEQVHGFGRRISSFEFVTLCYRRPRHGTSWPYNLYCMIHGKNRGTVLEQLRVLEQVCQLSGFNREILFSRRCFKQRGAIYQNAAPLMQPALANG